MPGVIISVKGDASQFKSEMLQIEALAKKMGASVQQSLVTGHGGAGGVRSGAIRETLVLMREIGRGNWTRVPGSFSLLIQQLGFLKYILNPIALGIVALGAAAFFVIRAFNRAAEATRYWNDLLETHAAKAKDVADAQEKMALAAQEQADWLKKQGDHEKDLTRHIETNLELMRERAKLNKELAENMGANPKQLAQMDIDEARRELGFLLSWQKEIASRAGGNLDSEKAAANQVKLQHLTDPALDQAKNKVKELSEIFDLVAAKNDEYRNRTRTNGPVTFSEMSEGMPEDVETIKHGGVTLNKSLNDVANELNYWKQTVTDISTRTKALDDALAEKKKLVEQDNAVSGDLNNRIEKLQGELRNKQELLPSIASASQGHMGHGHVSSLQQVGAYTSPAVQIHTLVGKAVRHLANIDKHTSTGGKGSTGGSTVPVNYGH